jgi:hypothetical protein
LLLHGIQAETRAAWIAWIVLFGLIALFAPKRRLVVIGLVAFPLILMLIRPYVQVIWNNFAETQATFSALSSGNTARMGEDDLIREIGRRAGVAMFYARPVLGGGPGTFLQVKGQFIASGPKYEQFGPFNSWLLLLAEMGILTTAATGLAVLIPLTISVKLLLKTRNEVNWLAFSFSLGVLGMAIHLYFISAMYSFFWFYVSLAIASARLAKHSALDTQDTPVTVSLLNKISPLNGASFTPQKL